MTGRLRLVARSAALAKTADAPGTGSLENTAPPAASSRADSSPTVAGSSPVVSSVVSNPIDSNPIDSNPTVSASANTPGSPSNGTAFTEAPALNSSIETARAPESGALIKNLVKATLFAALLVAGTLTGLNSYRYFSTHEETDDATVAGHIHLVSARVAGNVNEVLVDDNQRVEKGQVLLRLDPDDYAVRVQQAEAEVELAKRQAEVSRVRIGETSETANAQGKRATGDIVESQASLQNFKEKIIEAEAGVSAAKEQLAQTQATLEKNLIDYKRYALLEQQGAVSTQQLDTAKRDLFVSQAAERGARDGIKQAESRLSAAREAVAQAAAHLTATGSEIHQARASQVQILTSQKQYEADLASVEQSQAKLKDARLQRSYTTTVAPVSGTIGRKSVEAGQRLQPGQQIMAIVPDNYWVVANFKETQLERMHDGQPVEIKVDAFPHHVFIGHVDSVSPASGAQFALLPPDNATGNFTKIVQRVPVKIIFDRNSIKGFESRIAPGMSVVAQVSIDK